MLKNPFKNDSTFGTLSILGAALSLLLLPANAPGQSYDYDAAGRLVRMVYSEGGGIGYTYDLSDNILAVMPLNVPPAPTGVEVTRLSATSAQIKWQGDQSATGYVIERRAKNSTVWEEVATVSASTNTFIDPGLEAGVEYVYRVSATGADGRSARSAEAEFGGPPRLTISENGVLDGAGFEAERPIAPGSIVSVFGENIGVRTTGSGLEVFTESAKEVPVATTLADYSVRFGQIEAPLFFVGGKDEGGGVFTGQINAQVPWEVTPGEVEVAVVHSPAGGEVRQTNSVTVRIASVAPSLFTFDYGPGRVAALNLSQGSDDVINGSIAQPEGAFPGIVTQPAKPGGIVTLFANGLGPTEPAGQTGLNSLDALRGVKVPVRVLVGGAEAQLLFAGLTPEFVGLYQINILIPQGVVPGDKVPIVLEQGGVRSRGDVTIAVRP